MENCIALCPPLSHLSPKRSYYAMEGGNLHFEDIRRRQKLYAVDRLRPTFSDLPLLGDLKSLKPSSWPPKSTSLPNPEEYTQREEKIATPSIINDDAFRKPGDDPTTTESPGEYPSPCPAANGNCNGIPVTPRARSFKSDSPIPNRPNRAQFPIVRMPPSGLWRVSSSSYRKPPACVDMDLIKDTPSDIIYTSSAGSGASTSQSISMESPPPEHHQPYHVMQSILASGYSKLSPIGSDRPRGLSLHPEALLKAAAPGRSHLSSDAGATAASLKSAAPLPFMMQITFFFQEPIAHNFVRVMHIRKLQNKHAPMMASMFNPLRAYAPAHSWRHLPVDARKSPRARPPKFTTPLQSGMRSGQLCFSNLGHRRNECFECQRDSIGKRMLISHYQRSVARQEAEFLAREQVSEIMDQEMDIDLIEDGGHDYEAKLPDSPELRDLDDFDEGDDSDALVDKERIHDCDFSLF